jgi:cell division protein ZapA
MENGKVKVNIYGQTYNIRGDAPPEYILELAEYVNSKMEEVALNVTSSNSLQIAILVSLNIADEYFQLKKLNVGIEGVIEEKTREIISMLDEGLIGDIFSGVDTVHP